MKYENHLLLILFEQHLEVNEQIVDSEIYNAILDYKYTKNYLILLLKLFKENFDYVEFE
jgi:hypothetical protein